jgi:uncharacterized protein (TIGR02145 family)
MQTFIHMQKSIFTFFTFAFIGLLTALGQAGIGTTTPDASAALEVQSTFKGFLPPRMTEANRQGIINPAKGLIIYCIDCGAEGQLQLYNGAVWTNMAGGTATAGQPPIPSVFSANGKEWMDRNLGASMVTQAARSSYSNQVDYIAAQEASFGDLYQWGRAADGHQDRSLTCPLGCYDVKINGDGVSNFSDNPANAWYGLFVLRDNSDNNWVDPSTANANDLWQVLSGINNPCPSGYRLPTETEWNNERLSWVDPSINSQNNADGAFASPLKLPLAGRRSRSSGLLDDVGSFGGYWSSSISATVTRLLAFNGSGASISSFDRANGVSVRCIKN